MAESKGTLLAKSVSKHAGRAKEKILQNLGKVDRTADEIFDDHLQNFSRQQSSAIKLQKEFNNYIRCVRAVQMASKSLMDAICEIYEPQWSGYDSLLAQVNSTETLWQDFSHKLGDQVLIPLNTYSAQFPEMKKKVEKRNRKLIDYDSQRHSFQNLQANASKRKDDVKITKGREQLEEARRTYEILNTELHDELPALFDSRVLFLVTNLQTLFASEQVFHAETEKIYTDLEAIVDKLATESQRGTYSLKKSTINPTKISSTTPAKSNNNSNYTNQITNGSTNANSPSPTTSSPSSLTDQSSKFNERPITPPSPNMPVSNNDNDSKNEREINEPSYQNTSAVTSASELTNTDFKNIKENENLKSPSENTTTTTTAASNNEIIKLQHNSNSDQDQVNENVGQKVIDATTTDMPPGVLYRVKATYCYVKEDGDELSFDVGDIIRVIEYDDPDDQEEGWLMGEKEGTTEKGLFPANFTRPI